MGLRDETLRELMAPAMPATRGFFDEVIKGEAAHALGFMKNCAEMHLGGPASFGTPGAGGSVGFADPESKLGYAYITNKMGCVLTGDPRDLALRDAVYSSIQSIERSPRTFSATA